MYHLNSIGKIKLDQEHIMISVEGKFAKALKHLNQFSHVHVFYAYKHDGVWRLDKAIVMIQEVNVKKGIVRANPTKKLLEEGELMDLKPYFPCEDAVKSMMPSSGDRECPMELVKTDSEDGYSLEAIGMIRNVNGSSYIQLNHAINVKSRYIKIYWWFHKYDTKKFRHATQCTPPYEDAPKTGIFATRSPVRPNPIAMTIAKVQKVDQKEKRIYISGIESFDKTPCLGISPYESAEDCIRECQVPEWLSHWPQWLDDLGQKSDLQEITIKESGLEALLRADNKTIDEEPSEKLSTYAEDKIEEGRVKKISI